MTFERFMNARRDRQGETSTEQQEHSREIAHEGGEATAESPARKTADDHGQDELDDYVQRVQPAATARYELCSEVEQAILHGTDGAPPARVLEALEVPSDPKISAYTQKYRDELVLCCVNHGIDPSTGEPDRQLQCTLAALIAQGGSESEALAAVCLAAHRTIPAILMRDAQFRRAIESARPK